MRSRPPHLAILQFQRVPRAHAPGNLLEQVRLHRGARHAAQHPAQFVQHRRIRAFRRRRRSLRSSTRAGAGLHQRIRDRAARQSRLQRRQRRTRSREEEHLRLAGSRDRRVMPIVLLPRKEPERPLLPDRPARGNLPLLPPVGHVYRHVDVRDRLPVQVLHRLARRRRRGSRRLRLHHLAVGIPGLPNRPAIEEDRLAAHAARPAFRHGLDRAAAAPMFCGIGVRARLEQPHRRLPSSESVPVRASLARPERQCVVRPVQRHAVHQRTQPAKAQLAVPIRRRGAEQPCQIRIVLPVVRQGVHPGLAHLAARIRPAAVCPGLAHSPRVHQHRPVHGSRSQPRRQPCRRAQAHGQVVRFPVAQTPRPHQHAISARHHLGKMEVPLNVRRGLARLTGGRVHQLYLRPAHSLPARAGDPSRHRSARLRLAPAARGGRDSHRHHHRAEEPRDPHVTLVPTLLSRTWLQDWPRPDLS